MSIDGFGEERNEAFAQACLGTLCVMPRPHLLPGGANLMFAGGDAVGDPTASIYA